MLDGAARLVNAAGDDVTEQYIRGARETAQLAALFGVKVAYLKAKSPACGVGRTHVGGKVAPGNGVAAAALLRQGIRIIEVE